jgi:uncharacterized protein DUF4430
MMELPRNGASRKRTLGLLVVWILLTASGCGTQSGPTSDSPRKENLASDRAPVGSGEKSAAASPTTQPAARTVQLVLDYGDGVQKRFAAIPWRENMTVLDVLMAAKAHPRGITFIYRGSGETAILTKLDDLENQGGIADAKNWIFYVNDRLADKSFGAYVVQPGDAILWKFGIYE